MVLASAPACNATDGFCCGVTAYTFPGIELGVYQTMISSVALLSLLYLLIKLCRDRERHFPVYFNFILFTVFTFWVIIIVQAIPPTTEKGTALYYVEQVVHLTYISMQWFVQFAVVIFMFQSTPHRAAVKRTVWRALGAVFFLAVIWVAFDFFLECYWCGGIVPESIITLTFLAVVLLPYTPWKDRAPRPAAYRWCWFCLVCHTLFLINYLCIALLANPNAGQCMLVIADLFYYTLYALVLYSVMMLDWKYWQENGISFLLGEHGAESGYGSINSRTAAGFGPNGAEAPNRASPHPPLSAGASGSPSKISPVETLGGPVRVIRYDQLNLGKLVGVGQFSEVFRSTWFSTVVAVKRFKVAHEADLGNLVDDMMKESTMLSRLQHPNIIQFYGVCDTPPHICMVTEYLALGCLTEILEKQDKLAFLAFTGETYAAPEGPKAGLVSSFDSATGDMRQMYRTDLSKIGFRRRMKKSVAMSWKTCVRLMHEIALGMQYLHAQDPPIVHRDLKSLNICLDEAWVPKVCDFGISRSQSLSTTMTRVGTPQWMSPEVLRAEDYTILADVWGFGVVAWELVTFHLPYNRLNAVRVIRMVGHDGVTLEVPPQCPPRVAELIRSCWTPPEGRPSFSDLTQALADYLAELN